jgi:hypothetical protein
VASSGRFIIGFDGTPAAKHALFEAAALFRPRSALVVVVWEAGRAFELATLPSGVLEMPPSVFDIRTAFQVDKAMYANVMARELLAQSRSWLRVGLSAGR